MYLAGKKERKEVREGKWEGRRERKEEKKRERKRKEAHIDSHHNITNSDSYSKTCEASTIPSILHTSACSTQNNGSFLYQETEAQW